MDIESGEQGTAGAVHAVGLDIAHSRLPAPGYELAVEVPGLEWRSVTAGDDQTATFPEFSRQKLPACLLFGLWNLSAVT